MTVRGSFRMGLRLGLLVGIAFALFKTIQSRRSSDSPATEPWQPIVDTPRPRPPGTDEPNPPMRRPVDEVGEPIEEPAPLDLRMPDVPRRAEPEPAMVAEDVLDPEPVAKPEPLDIIHEDHGTAAGKVTGPVERAKPPNRKAAKKAANTAKKSTKRPAKASGAEDAKQARPRSGRTAAFVEPVGGTCPPTHPVKAKLSSRLFHLPGMLAYDRTRPDRCFLDEAAAEAEGFTRARR